jgi:hypothetical protein
MPIRWRCLREWQRGEWFGRDELPLIRALSVFAQAFLLPTSLRRQPVVVMVLVTVDQLE